MSYTPPKVYISATAAGLRSVLEGMKEAMMSVDLVPVEIASFESDWSKVADGLRQQIESCDALVHVAGTRYGAEPDPATLPPGTPRCSYAQMEYYLGCEAKEKRGEDFKIYVFVCPEDFPFDPAPGIEISEKWSLQDAHRNRIVKSPYFTGSPESADDMRQWAVELRQQFPPPPPPPPPEPPNADGAATAAEGDADSEMPTPADVAGDTPNRSRMPLVLGVLALMCVVVLVAAFLIVRQFGWLDDKFAFMTKADSGTVSTEKSEDFAAVEPEPKPAAPLPKAKVVEAPPPVEPPAPAPKPKAATSPPPSPSTVAVAEKPAVPAPTPLPVAPSPLPSKPVASGSPSASVSPRNDAEINLVRKATVAANPASKLSVAEIGKFYVDKPVYDGKTITREDVMRQVDQFRRNWDIQTYEIVEGPKVTAGEGTNHMTVKVKTRFVGMRKTAVQLSTATMTSEYVVVVEADGSALIESVREVARE